MLLLQHEENGRLWFMTDVDSRKAHDVVRERMVNVSFMSPRGDRYVSLSGRAILVRDPRKVKELWNPTYRAWFPRGTRDPELVLLAVEVFHAEYWIVPTSRVARVASALRAVVTRRRYEAGTHGAIEFPQRRAA